MDVKKNSVLTINLKTSIIDSPTEEQQSIFNIKDKNQNILIYDAVEAIHKAKDDDNINDALREVMQEIALAALARAGFFDKAAFYGGTCLRIFYDLPRFSEDLDFSLLQTQKDFSFEPYFDTLVAEFNALGFEVDISEREKSIETAVVSAFLKKNTSIYDVSVRGQKVLKIKFEVDTEPPLGFKTEEKLLLNPYICTIIISKIFSNIKIYIQL